VATFEDGWICKKCWSANRDSDSRCYRCHSEPAGYATFQSKVSLPSAAVPSPAPAPPVAAPVPSPTRETVVSQPPEPITKAPKAMRRWTLPSLPSIGVPRAFGSMSRRIASAGHRVRASWNEAGRRAAAIRRRAGMFTFWLSAMVLCWLVIFFELAPESAGGRLMASVLATLGLGLFSAATAAVTSAAMAERRGSRGVGESREG
jgi:hypothetical protein